MTEVRLQCRKCGAVRGLQAKTKNQLSATLRKGVRCIAPTGQANDVCRGELEVVEPEEWRGA